MRNSTIKTRLSVSFGILVVLLVTLATVTFVVTRGMRENCQNTVDVSVKNVILVDALNVVRGDMRASLRAAILYTYAKKPDLVEANRAKFEEGSNNVTRLLAQLRPLLETEEEREAANKLESGFQAWASKFQTIHQLCIENNPVEAEAFGTRETKSIAEGLGENLKKLDDIQQKQLEESKALIARQAATAAWVSFSFLLIGFFAAAGVVLVIHKIDRQLRELSLELQQGSEQLTSAASEISSSSQTLAQASSEQAASLQQTSSSTEEIRSMTQQNSANVNSAVGLTAEMTRNIETGNCKLGNMVDAMTRINSSSEKVSKIIKVIDEIAFQTNILALNAAVEAARAGESGAGFAVVADEVRNLAQRCAQAANETSGLISESVAESSTGKRIVEEVVGAIAEVTRKSTTIRTLVEEVGVASQEQAKGLDEIANSIGQMEQVTHKTAASSEQTAAAGQQLSAQATTLKELVEGLNQLVGA